MKLQILIKTDDTLFPHGNVILPENFVIENWKWLDFVNHTKLMCVVFCGSFTCDKYNNNAILHVQPRSLSANLH